MRIEGGKSFGMLECPSCATEVPANNNHCPICGYEFLRPSPRHKQIKLLAALVMLALFLGIILALW